MADVSVLLQDLDYRRSIQKALSEKTGFELFVDGVLGKATTNALSTYQIKNGFRNTGVFDEATRDSLEPFMLAKFLQHQDFLEAATQLGVPLASVYAVQSVESKGCGFLTNGRAVILFERHKFYEELRKVMSTDQLTALYQKNPDIINATAGGYLGGANEWPRFSRAFNINGEAAMRSTSWGLFQIMGFNYKDAGFPNVGAYVDAMKLSEREQLKAFCSFIKVYAGGRAYDALLQRDWKTFARLYNGSNYAINKYDVKLENAFADFSKLYP